MKIEHRKLIPIESKNYRDLRLESLQLYPNSFGSDYEEQVAREKLYFEKVIEERLSDKFIIGAFNRKELIGICGFFRNQEEDIKHIGTIIQFYVKNNYQGKGIGQALLRATISKAFEIETLEQIDLSVLTQKKQVHQIYERIGFNEYGFRKRALKNGDHYRDERFMVLFRKDYLKA